MMKRFGIGLMILALGSSGLSAATVYVDAGASGADDGSSWANAYTSLSAAITAAAAGDELWVKAGTYYPGTLRPDKFIVSKNLTIYGGFAGTETSASERSPSTNVTTLSGDIGTPNDASDNSYNIVYLTAGTVTIEGFTIKGARSQTSSDSGAGLRVSGASTTAIIRYCKFVDNQAGLNNGSGGGAAVSGPGTIVEECVFDQNRANRGAGLSVGVSGTSGSPPLIKNCSFRYNETSDDGSGGAARTILFSGSTLSAVFNGCSFFNNDAGSNTLHGSGGGLSLSAPTSVIGCSFDSNVSGARGGAIHASTYPLTVTGCIFNNNQALGGYGGAINCAIGNYATIDRCYFLFNSAFTGSPFLGSGGGVAISSATGTLPVSTVSNCLFWGNWSDDGGNAVWTSQGVRLSGNTFYEQDGGGATIGYGITNSSRVKVQNSILWGNYGTGDLTPASYLDVEYSTVEGGWSGTGNISSDPLLVSDFPDSFNWWPDTGSPAIGAGSNSLTVGSLDLAGNSRTVSTVDMGAIEAQ